MIFTPRQWLIIASSFIVLALSSGLMFSFSIFLKELESAFEGSRSGVSFGYSIFMVVGSISAILMGRLSDRYGTRKVVVLGTVLNVIALGFASVMNSVRSNFDVVPGTSSALLSSPVNSNPVNSRPLFGAFCNTNITWNTGCRLRSRSGSRASTSLSKGRS